MKVSLLENKIFWGKNPQSRTHLPGIVSIRPTNNWIQHATNQMLGKLAPEKATSVATTIVTKPKTESKLKDSICRGLLWLYEREPWGIHKNNRIPKIIGIL